MLEIKFRAWDKRLCQWNKDLAISNNGQLWLRSHDDKHSYWRYGVIPRKSSNNTVSQKDFVIMQYTGLKDKNGKEIYEGDIVKCPAYPTESNPMGEPFFGIVIYKQGAFCYQYESLYCESLISLYDGDEAYEEEVIGNIWENKELLNGQ